MPFEGLHVTNQPLDGELSGNSERLKVHLEAGSLAAAFLDAWFKPDTPQERQARLLAALDAHGSTEGAGSAPASAD